MDIFQIRKPTHVDELKRRPEAIDFFTCQRTDLYDGLDIIYEDSIFEYLFTNNYQEVGQAIIKLYERICSTVESSWTPEEGTETFYLRVYIYRDEEEGSLFKATCKGEEFFKLKLEVNVNEPFEMFVYNGCYGYGDTCLVIEKKTVAKNFCKTCGIPEGDITPLRPIPWLEGVYCPEDYADRIERGDPAMRIESNMNIDEIEDFKIPF